MAYPYKPKLNRNSLRMAEGSAERSLEKRSYYAGK
jgi:hypothetical protein